MWPRTSSMNWRLSEIVAACWPLSLSMAVLKRPEAANSSGERPCDPITGQPFEVTRHTSRSSPLSRAGVRVELGHPARFGCAATLVPFRSAAKGLGEWQKKIPREVTESGNRHGIAHGPIPVVIRTWKLVGIAHPHETSGLPHRKEASSQRSVGLSEHEMLPAATPLWEFSGNPPCRQSEVQALVLLPEFSCTRRRHEIRCSAPP